MENRIFKTTCSECKEISGIGEIIHDADCRNFENSLSEQITHLKEQIKKLSFFPILEPQKQKDLAESYIENWKILRTELAKFKNLFKNLTQCDRCGGYHEKRCFPKVDEIMLCFMCRHSAELESEIAELKQSYGFVCENDNCNYEHTLEKERNGELMPVVCLPCWNNREKELKNTQTWHKLKSVDDLPPNNEMKVFKFANGKCETGFNDDGLIFTSADTFEWHEVTAYCDIPTDEVQNEN